MNHLYKLLVAAFCTSIFLSCSDDPLPLPDVQIATDPGVIEVGIEVQFENQSLNASSYLWDFGGGVTSEEISPRVTFTSAGEGYVKLTAFNQDGASVTDSILVSIKERYLTGYAINIFPETKEGGVNWDVDPIDPDTVYADLLVSMFTFPDVDQENVMLDGIFGDVPSGPIVRIFQSSEPQAIKLTNEDWAFGLEDYDGPLDEIDLAETESMIGVVFNPIEIPAIKNDDGDAGYFSVIYFDQSTGYYIDVDIAFEIR